MKQYLKGNQIVFAFNKFVYCSTVYQIWSWGASLLEEKYYASNRPITLKKQQLVLKKKTYSLHRFFELKFAPEEWLQSEGWKLIND